MKDFIPASLLAPSLDVFCGFDQMGLTAQGLRHEPRLADGNFGATTIVCRAIERVEDRFCHRCGSQGRVRDSRLRSLTHLPFGERPTKLLVRFRRYRCDQCAHIWSQSLTRVASPRSPLTRTAARWAFYSLAINKLSVAAVARHLALSWDATWKAIKDLATPVFNNPQRLEGVKAIGIDEHAWRHRPGRDPYQTVIVDLTPVIENTGPARLLDMIDARASPAIDAWLAGLDQSYRHTIEAAAMDGLAAYKKAVTNQLDYTTIALDPFHVVTWAGAKVTAIRQRLSHEIYGRRGHTGDPLYHTRKILLTSTDYLTTKGRTKLAALFDNSEYNELHTAWRIYQDIIHAYRHPDTTIGQMRMSRVIETIKPGTNQTISEIASLGRTLASRRTDILAAFDHPHLTNGPVEAINGRIEHLRGIALGFRNPHNYKIRALIHSGQPHLHP